MAAPKGNQFWRMKSKHGREKLFATPELMWEAACEYFESIVNNPIKVVEYKVVDKMLQKVEVPHTPPFTIQGLCRYLDCNTSYFAEFKRDRVKCTEAFSAVIQAIERTIYEQKYTGAAVGIFNANIISRDLGLADKQIHETINFNSIPLSKQEIKDISDKLESDV